MKIVLTGPESTGKSTLAAQLATHYQTVWVEEYARAYIQSIGRLYEEADLINIAKGQLQRISEKEMQKQGFLFCDTSLLVVKVWSEYKYGRCHDWILEQLKAQQIDLYFLCGIDTPWTFDEQREHPSRRKELYHIYKSELKEMRVPFVELQGNEQERLKKAIDVIECVFNNFKPKTFET